MVLFSIHVQCSISQEMWGSVIMNDCFSICLKLCLNFHLFFKLLVFCRMHVAPAKVKCDRQTDDWQSSVCRSLLRWHHNKICSNPLSNYPSHTYMDFFHSSWFICVINSSGMGVNGLYSICSRHMYRYQTMKSNREVKSISKQVQRQYN